MFTFMISVIFCIYPELELLDCMVTFIFSKELSCYFTQWLSHFTPQQFLHIPTNSFFLSFFLSLPPFLSFSLSPSLPSLMVIALLMGAEWYLTVVLICIFLMISYILHPYMCLLTICISLEKCPFKSLSIF